MNNLQIHAQGESNHRKELQSDALKKRKEILQNESLDEKSKYELLIKLKTFLKIGLSQTKENLY